MGWRRSSFIFITLMSVSKVCSAQARPGPSIGPKRKSPCFLPVSGRCRLISVVSTTSQLLNSERERERVFFSAWIHSYGYDLGFPILSTKIHKLNLDMATDLPCLLPFLLFLFISHFPLSFSGQFFNNSLNFFITTTILCFQLLIFNFFRFSKFNGVSSWSNKVNVCGFWWIPLC